MRPKSTFSKTIQSVCHQRCTGVHGVHLYTLIRVTGTRTLKMSLIGMRTHLLTNDQTSDNDDDDDDILFADLSQCQLTQLPDAVFLLMKNVSLNSFNISGNLLQKIPAKLPINFCLIKGE